MMLYYSLASLINLLISLAACGYILSRGMRIAVNRSLAFFAFAIAFFSLGYYIWILSDSALWALFWCRVLMAGHIFIPVTFFHFVINLIEEPKRFRKALLALYSIAFLFLIADITPFLIYDVGESLFFPYWPVGGTLFTPFLLFVVAVASFSIFLMMRKMRSSVGVAKLRLKYAAISLAIGFFGGFTNYPLCFGIPMPPWGIILISYAFIFCLYSLLKYRLVEITNFAKKIGIVTIAVIMTYVLSMASIGLYRFALNPAMVEDQWLLTITITIMLSAIGYTLSAHLMKRIDEEDLKRLKDAQKALEVSGRGMIDIDNRERLARIIPRYLTMFYRTRLNTRIEHATLFLPDKDRKVYVFASSSGNERIPPNIVFPFNSAICEWFKITRDQLIEKNIAEPQDISVLKVDDLDYWLQTDRLSNIRVDSASFLKKLKAEMKALNSIICVPGIFKNELIGFVFLGEKAGGVYSRAELDLFARLAQDAVLGFRNAELTERIRKFEKEKAKTEKLAAIGELLVCVRHEMGNILNNISMFNEAMKDACEDRNIERVHTLLSKTKETVEHAKSVWSYVDEYINKAKTPSVSEYNLRYLVDQAVQAAGKLFEKWKINVSTTVDPRIVVEGTASFPDIFKHLIINSCYAMEPDGGSITIDAQVSKDRTLSIKQSDTGDDLADVMKRYPFLTGGLFSERGKSGGINLFLAQKIIHDNHGSLELATNKPKGTTFILRYPIKHGN